MCLGSGKAFVRARKDRHVSAEGDCFSRYAQHLLREMQFAKDAVNAKGCDYGADHTSKTASNGQDLRYGDTHLRCPNRRNVTSLCYVDFMCFEGIESHETKGHYFTTRKFALLFPAPDEFPPSRPTNIKPKTSLSSSSMFI